LRCFCCVRELLKKGTMLVMVVQSGSPCALVSYYTEYQIPSHELGPYIHKMSARKQEASPVLVLKAPGFC